MNLKKYSLIFAIAAISVLLSGCVSVPGPSAPAISFGTLSPVEGQNVSVTVTSHDSYSNLTAELSVDGNSLSLSGVNGTYFATWTAVKGNHVFDATVTDSYGNSVSTTKALNVGVPNPPSFTQISWNPTNPKGGDSVKFSFSATSQVGIKNLNSWIDSTPLTVSNLGNSTYSATWSAVPGLHTVKLTATDSNGNASTTYVKMDVAPYPYPKITDFSWTPQYPTTADKNLIFTLSGYDPNGFIPSISVDGNPLYVTPVSTTSTDSFAALWTIVPGYHEVKVGLTDMNGWNTESVYHIAVTPQSGTMQIVLGSIPQTIDHGATMAISAVVYNYYPPMKKIWLYLDGYLLNTFSSTDTIKYTLSPSDGTHQIVVKAEDGVGMTAEATKTFTVSYDPESYLPKIESSFTPDATVGDTKILSARATATAPDGRITKVTFLDMITSKLIGETSSGSNGIYSVPWTPKEAGRVPILITAVDSNDMVASTVVGVTVAPVTINDGAPIIYPMFNSTIRQSSKVTLAASVVSKSKLAEVKMWVDDLPLTPSKDASGIYSITWIADATGTHVFKTYAEDVYGKAATSDFYFYVYSGNLPELVSKVNPDSVYIGGEVTLSATVVKSTYPINGIDFYVDDSLVGSSYSSPYTMEWKTKTEGAHTFTAEAIDTYGNKGYSSSPFTVYRDTTPPNISLSLPATAATDENVGITINSSDGESGVKSVKIEIFSSADPQPYPDILPIFSQTYDNPVHSFTVDFMPTKAATYTVYGTAEDRAGNSKKVSHTLSVK